MKQIKCNCGFTLVETEKDRTTISNEVLNCITGTGSIDKDTVELKIICPNCKKENNIIT